MTSRVDFFGFVLMLSDFLDEPFEISELKCCQAGRRGKMTSTELIKLQVQFFKTSEEVPFYFPSLSI